MTVTRKELLDEISRSCGLSKRAASEVFDVILEHMKDSLERGEKVSLRNFGTLTPVIRPARIARNPQQGIPMQVPQRADVRWKSSKIFRARLDGARLGKA